MAAEQPAGERRAAGRPVAPPPGLPLEPWRSEGATVARALNSDTGAGLTAEEAERRLIEFGPNELTERATRPVWLVLLEQFTNAMVVVLIAAAVVTALIGDVKDTVVILAIVFLNAGIGFIQEYRAEKAIEALKQMTSPSVRVVRGGEVTSIPASRLVPGDLVRLEGGDIVGADLRLLEVYALEINEAMLTGESEAAEKTANALPDVPAGLPADQRNIAFSGTAVTRGRGAGVVVATGMATALGHVADLLQTQSGGPTPLQRRLSTLARRLAGAAFVVCGIVFAAGIARGEPLDVMFLTAVSLAVAAIPEGLPAIVTVALALGARRLAQRRALVRRLPAVETLGSVTVICTDKTGTLTENRMLVERAWTRHGEYRVGGDGYAPEGAVEPSPAEDEDLARLAWVAVLCNDATLRPPEIPHGEWTIAGDPTEAALLAFAGKLAVDRGAEVERYPRAAELGFDSERRRMTTFHIDGDPGATSGGEAGASDAGGDTGRNGDAGPVRIATKGALEAILPLLAPDEVEQVGPARAAADRFAAQGYRVLALAEGSATALPADLEGAERGLRLVGLVGMADPPRPESAPAIATCRQAGITPVMVTGDHPLTGKAIAERIGILTPGSRVLSGAELEQMDDATFDRVVADIAVYARTSPEQKLRIVDAWRRSGGVVAMTGDGVNDAPALNRAEIGVSMGITGTEVSKEAADMILADDNFATIVAAVEEGRRIYDNLRRVVRYLLTTNSAEVWVMFLAPFFGLPLPLLAIQILWINLVTDGAPALALGVEPAEPDTMRRPPRRPTESIFAGGLWQHALYVGLLMTAATLSVQALAIANGWPWQTMVFTTLAFLQLGHALAIRSERLSVFQLGWRSNVPLAVAVVGTGLVQASLIYLPFLQPVFTTQALDPIQLGVVLVASPTAFVAVELEKLILRRRTAAMA